MRADQILPDDVDHGEFQGVPIRKGTVAAFLANARAWTQAGADTDARAQAAREIERDLPALRALGLFDILEIRDEELRAFVNAPR
jgi:antirestriction protein ArdC